MTYADKIIQDICTVTDILEDFRLIDFQQESIPSQESIQNNDGSINTMPRGLKL